MSGPQADDRIALKGLFLQNPIEEFLGAIIQFLGFIPKLFVIEDVRILAP